MTESSSRPGDHDDVMAQFFGDLERRGSAILDDYKRRYPQLAAEFDDAVRMQDVLGDTRPDSPLEVPARLGGFRIVRRLSAGGMGELYEAEQEPVGRSVVVKIIRRGRISPLTRGRFLREQEVLARLHQTNIVPLYAAGEEGRLQYYAMPYIDGAALSHVVQAVRDGNTAEPGGKTPTLAELAAKLGRPGAGATPAAEGSAAPAAEVARAADAATNRLTLSAAYFRSVAQALAEVAEAVHHAHGAGILHRDLKPSNVMVDRAGHSWVIDFGLAGYLGGDGAALDRVHAADGSPDPATASGVMGTPNYMAPEQFESKADARSDVWALGATMYELLTLRRAFSGESFAEVQAKVLAANPPRIEELSGNVPADLAAICRKAMRKEPHARYPSAQEFADDLRRWLRHEPTKARGAWAGRRMLLWSRRNPGWAASLLTSILAAGVIIGFAFAMEETKAREARARAREEGAAEEFKRAAKFESLLKELQGLRLTRGTDFWFQRAWAKVGEASMIRADNADLKNEAAATLSGLDAVREKEFTSFDTSWIVFAPRGERLLFGAARGIPNRPAANGARVWDVRKADMSTPSKQTEGGPVAFRKDGTAVQLVPGDKLSLQLRDVLSGEKLQEYTFSAPVQKEGMKQEDGMKFGDSPAGFAVLAMTPDATRVAATAVGP